MLNPDREARRRVGYVWDEICLTHDGGSQLRDDTADGWLPTPNYESPERLQRCHDALARAGVLEQLVALPNRTATEDDLALVHTAEHVAMVRATQSFDRPRPVGDYVNAGPDTWPAACAAAGGTIAAVEAVVHAAVDTAFALVRPPGHHANADTAMGSCLINNVAVAVRHAQRRLGLGRVAIVDWDVHHGNGTEDVFADDDSVLFVSVHQEDFYPPGRGRVDDRGAGAGLGYTINVPLPAGSGDEGYYSVFDRVVVPALRAFDPDLIVVSAGQDAAGTDPLGRMCLSAEAFRGMTERILAVADEVCDGRVLVVQEGGYSLGQMPWCVLAIVEALLGAEPRFPLDPMGIDGPTVLRAEESAAIDVALAAHRGSGPLSALPAP